MHHICLVTVYPMAKVSLHRKKMYHILSQLRVHCVFLQATMASTSIKALKVCYATTVPSILLRQTFIRNKDTEVSKEHPGNEQ